MAKTLAEIIKTKILLMIFDTVKKTDFDSLQNYNYK